MGDSSVNLSGQMSLSSDHFINKNISEIIMTYIKSSLNENKKTITTIFTSIGIVLIADITKTILLDFIREQKKEITNEILAGVKFIKIFSVIKHCFTVPFRLCMNGFNLCYGKLSLLFKKNVDKVIDNNNNNKSNYYTFSLNNTKCFSSNLLNYIEENKCEFNKITSDEFIISKNNILNNVIYKNIKIRFDNIEILLNETLIKKNDTINIQNQEYSISNIIDNIIDNLIDKKIYVVNKNEPIYIARYNNESIRF